VTVTGEFPNKSPFIYFFKVTLNKSKYILELMNNSKMKMNLKLILLGDKSLFITSLCGKMQI